MRFSLVLGLSLEVRRLQAVLRAWHPCLLKGHEVWVNQMKPYIFPKRQRPFLLKWQLIGCSTSVVP